jgi:hypothetical protein
MVDFHENIDVAFEFVKEVVWFRMKRSNLDWYNVVVW